MTVNDHYKFHRISRAEYKEGPFTRFEKDSIVAYRYGIRWLEGLKFTIGREYQIFLQDKNQKTLKISFKTFYGINKKVLERKYFQIIDKVWDYYFIDITNSYLDKYLNEEPFELCNVKIEKEGVTIKSTAGLLSKTVLIPWLDLGSSNYVTYFALYSKKAPANVNCSFKYHEEWNVTILYALIRTIEKNRETNVTTGI